jgi:D-3-phosphoglycerate dehydrogenase / 2-oxoglutarate reductase
MRIAIPDDYHGLVPSLECFQRLAGHEVRVYREAAPSFNDLVHMLRGAEIIVPIRERTRFTRELLSELPELRLISQTGRSTHHIDVSACTERGIRVAAGTHASPRTVAEHTWALILGARRHIDEETALMRAGRWRESFSLGLTGRTLGVLGLGTIGRLVAATGATFGMRVLVWGRAASLTAARDAGYAIAASQRELFAQADVLTLHARLTPESRGLVTATDLSAMKRDALLVNTARAELIEAHALEAALAAGRPGQAAVDVYENEPVLGGDHPLLRLPQALCTAHSAWLERDTYELYFGEAFDHAVDFATGRPVLLVNPEVARLP